MEAPSTVRARIQHFLLLRQARTARFAVREMLAYFNDLGD
jgi:hypothetical protein